MTRKMTLSVAGGAVRHIEELDFEKIEKAGGVAFAPDQRAAILSEVNVAVPLADAHQDAPTDAEVSKYLDEIAGAAERLIYAIAGKSYDSAGKHKMARAALFCVGGRETEDAAEALERYRGAVLNAKRLIGQTSKGGRPSGGWDRVLIENLWRLYLDAGGKKKGCINEPSHARHETEPSVSKKSFLGVALEIWRQAEFPLDDPGKLAERIKALKLGKN